MWEVQERSIPSTLTSTRSGWETYDYEINSLLSSIARMPQFDSSLETIYAVDRTAWRNWLIQHYETAIGVWLIYYKVSSGKPSIRYSEAVKEALCFGWIDSKVNSIDAERYRQIFTPRKPKSVWSKLNKQYVEELIEQGLMTTAGLSKIAAAQADGSWSSLDAIEALIVPADLEQALSSNQLARRNFAALSNTAKKQILTWICAAKRSETRRRRIEQAVIAVAENRSPLDRN